MGELLLPALGALPVGLLLGAIVGILGAGGGIIALPVLIHIYGHSPHVATMESLMIVWATALIALIQKIRKSNATQPLPWRIAINFAIFSMLGAIIGRHIAPHIHEDILMWAFATFVLIVAIAMILNGWKGKEDSEEAEDFENSSKSMVVEKSSGSAGARAGLWSMVHFAAVAAGVGALTGLFGVGGGFIVVPALCVLGGMGMYTATGASTVVMFLTATAGILSPLVGSMIAGGGVGLYGAVDWPVVGGFGAGSIVAAAIASPLGALVPEKWLRRSFIVLLILIGVLSFLL
ncbi:MAG: sulfite exporter TauE/SafE family protein [Corynebacterium sp.]|nr:sulfite exporter TauE/SafE family protein [Corynebacterium sp.]